MPKKYKQNCTHCGNYYEGIGYKYCSPKCSNESASRLGIFRNREVRKCNSCGNNFTSKKSDLKVYCSRQCVLMKRDKNYSEHTWLIEKATTIDKRLCNIRTKCSKQSLPILNKSEFINWYATTTKSCFYCQIPEETWVELYKGFCGKSSLTIDRMVPHLGYVQSNMVFCCYHCNVVKSNVLSKEEMMKVAEMFIKPKWMKLISSQEEVQLGRF